ncbi:MAG: hypothetical protein KDC46_07555 [Thermoleophilia bacterium]|nr:hypothetical protein [Thermoleophilia bacterium]
MPGYKILLTVHGNHFPPGWETGERVVEADDGRAALASVHGELEAAANAQAAGFDAIAVEADVEIARAHIEATVPSAAERLSALSSRHGRAPQGRHRDPQRPERGFNA